MTLQNFNEALTKDLTNNKCTQQIWFCNILVPKIFDIANKFAINKILKNYFLAGNKLCICHLIYNFSQFKLLSKISKVLASNLENFFESNSVNLSLIIKFDKVINEFTLKTANFRIANLDIGYFIIINYVLSCLKELLA